MRWLPFLFALFLCSLLIFPLSHLNENGWNEVFRHTLQLRRHSTTRTDRSVVHEAALLAGDLYPLGFLALFGQSLNLFFAFCEFPIAWQFQSSMTVHIARVIVILKIGFTWKGPHAPTARLEILNNAL